MKIKYGVIAGLFISMAMADAKSIPLREKLVASRDKVVKTMRETFERFEGHMECVRQRRKCTGRQRKQIVATGLGLLAVVTTGALLGYGQQRKKEERRPLEETVQETYQDYAQELEGEFMTALGKGVAMMLLDPGLRLELASGYSEGLEGDAQRFLAGRNGIVETLQEVRQKLAKGEISLMNATYELDEARRRYMPMIQEVTNRYRIALAPVGERVFQLILTEKDDIGGYYTYGSL